MKLANKLFITLSFALLSNACAGQQTIPSMKENEVYQVWEYKHLTYSDGEKDVAVFDTKFIKPLPQQIKTIIAYYASRLPYWVGISNEIRTAQAFGDFSTIHDAQTALLKDWKYAEPAFPARDNQNARTFIATLYAMNTGKQIVFWYFKSYDKTINCDAFEIAKNASFRHVEHWENIVVDKITNKPVLWKK